MPRTPSTQNFARLVRRSGQMGDGNGQRSSLADTVVSRRQFLKVGGVTAAAAAVTLGTDGPLGATSALARAPRKKVAIIGAGLAGLRAAYALRGSGLDVQVYEAGDRVGGRCVSYTDPKTGLVLDLGGSFINSDHKEMRTLAKTFKLDLFDRIKNGREVAKDRDVPFTGYYFDGQLRDEAVVARALGPLADKIVEDGNALFKDYDAVAPRFDRLSAAEYLDRHIDLVPGDAVARRGVQRLLSNAIRTEYGVEPNKSSALQLLFLFPTVNGDEVELLGYSDEKFTVKGGVGQIPQRLAAALPRAIEFDRTLTKIAGSDSDGYRLDFGSSLHARADYVIVAVPASRLRDITFDIALPAIARDYVRSVDLGRNEKTFIGVTDKAWRDEFAVDVWTDLGFSAGWDGTQRQSGLERGAFTAYSGGAEVARLPLTNRGAGEVQLGRLAQIAPRVADVATGRFLRTDWTGDPNFRGAYSSFEPGQLTKFSAFFWIEAAQPDEAQSVSAGNVILAGEHTSDEWYGFMEGGVQTGRLAAELIAERAGVKV